MSFSFSFTPNPNLVIACLLIPLLWMAIGVIVLGWYRRRRAYSRLPNPSRPVDKHWWEQLMKWQVISPHGYDWLAVQEVTRCFDLITSSGLIGMGIALVLLLLGGALISLVATGTLVGITLVPNGLFMLAAVYLSSLLGYSLGYAYGVWRLRHSSAGNVTYGDLHPRRLADYRSVAFPSIAGFLIADVTLITLALAPHLGPQVPFTLLDGRQVEAPAWVLVAVPGAMLLTLMLGEGIMARIAQLPRLLITAHPQTAQRADNFLRARTINLLQGFELAVIGGLGVAQALLLMENFWLAGFWQTGSQPYSPLLDLELLIALVVMLSGFLLQVCFGRIGGRITGWPWRPVSITP